MNDRHKNDARRLYRYLRDAGWKKQTDIKVDLGLRGVTVRKIANEYAPYFISNTTDGYNVLENVSRDEIEHSIADLRSRATKMTTRADSLQRALDNRTSKQIDMLASTGQQTTLDDIKPRIVQSPKMSAHPGEPKPLKRGPGRY